MKLNIPDAAATTIMLAVIMPWVVYILVRAIGKLSWVQYAVMLGIVTIVAVVMARLLPWPFVFLCCIPFAYEMFCIVARLSGCKIAKPKPFRKGKP